MNTTELKEKIEKCITIAQDNMELAESCSDPKMRALFWDNVNQILKIAEGYSHKLKEEFKKELQNTNKN